MSEVNPTPKPTVAARLLLWCIAAYRLLLSPWMGRWCRFEPTCSAYTKAAIESHGAVAGAYLGARRILRCHPWCEAGCDPVPDRAEWAAQRSPLARFSSLIR